MESWEIPDGLECIGKYATAEEAHERGLVVLSARQPYWLHEDEDEGICLLVPESNATQLAYQVQLFEKESIGWPPPEPAVPDEEVNAWAVFFWIGTMTLAYLAQLRWPDLFDWGMLSSEKVREGEIYRCLSALFLHGDIGHLAGNCIFGVVLVYLVSRQIGNFLTLVAVFLSGTMGNFLNAWIHFGGIHYSVGASTAVFGCIGILVTLKAGYALRNFRERIVHVWALPFVTGWIMLAWFGTGSEFTDTTAHLFGFLCGLPLGIGLGMLRKE